MNPLTALRKRRDKEMNRKKYLLMVFFASIFNVIYSQSVQYKGENIDTISIECITAFRDIKNRSINEQDIFSIYYSDSKNCYVVEKYAKIKNNTHKVIKKYTHNSIPKNKVQGLMASLEINYKKVRAEDFGIYENNIDSIINTMKLNKLYKDEFIQKFKNIDNFKLFLAKKFGEQCLNSYGISSVVLSAFRIKIKTHTNTYLLSSSNINNCKQPWNIVNHSLYENVNPETMSINNIFNFNINKSLIQILPSKFMGIDKLKIDGILQDYIEWCVNNSR